MAKKILVVLTSADKIVKLDKPTGWYLVRRKTTAKLTPLSFLGSPSQQQRPQK